MSDKKHAKFWTKEELISLPYRAWDKVSEYISLLILPSDELHDSGYSNIYIIGVIDNVPVEIITSCSDDIKFKFPPMLYIGDYSIGQVRMDCMPESKAFQLWTREGKFRVNEALSSIAVELIK